MRIDASSKRLVQLLKNVKKVQPDRLAPLYERHGVDPDAGPKALVVELGLDGANTLASLLRGWEGVQYGEIVRDVADKMDVRHSGGDGEVEIERKIVEHVVASYLKNATEAQREEIQGILDELGREHRHLTAALVRGGVAVGTSVLTQLIRAVGAPAVAQVVSKLIARILGVALGKQAATTAARALGYAVPLLNVVLVAWTVMDIAGPAFRKTVPSVLEIALLRLEFDVCGKEAGR